jgi:hypothetical protein
LPFGDPWHALLNGVDLFSADFMLIRLQGQVEARDSVFILPPSDNP